MKHVREVVLMGKADGAYWREVLEREQLTPKEVQGQAEILVSVTALRWMGIRFNEFNLIVSVEPPPGYTSADAGYLVRAFNSSSLLALAERRLFQTPYYPGQITMQDRGPASLHLSDGEVTVFEARMAEASGGSKGETLWDGPAFLPTPEGSSERKLFYAQLEGGTESYPFTSADILIMRPWAEHPALSALIESEFAPVEWRIGHDATHKKSKTYART